MLIFIAKPSTYATCYLIEFCQIVVTLSEIHFILPWSRSRTRFHHMLCFYTRSKQISIHPQNKTPSPCMTHLSQKYIKDMGLWENKRCIPKEGMPHASACQKKEKKDAYPKKVCHMLRHVKKKKKKRKEKIAPYPKRKKKREMVHTKEFIHHPPKISTHLHILIKIYDLFLLWIRSLT